MKVWSCNKLFNLFGYVVLLFVLLSAPVYAGVFDQWVYRSKITFSGYDKSGTLTNFPALIILSTNITNFDYSYFTSETGADLRFADSNETTELNYEIEQWNTNGESCVWVQVPEIKNMNSFIYAYWGKTGASAPAYTMNGAAWSNGHIGVWHMSQADAQDSTAHGHNGTAEGSVSNVSSGLIARANEFDADVDYISVPDSDDFTLSEDYSVSAWINSDALTDWEAIMGTYNGAGFIFPLYNDAGNTLRFWDGSWRLSDTSIPDGQWKHVVYTREGSAGIFYVDGLNVKTRNDAAAGGNGGALHLNTKKTS
jgi:hypothetical protein